MLILNCFGIIPKRNWYCSGFPATRPWSFLHALAWGLVVPWAPPDQVHQRLDTEQVQGMVVKITRTKITEIIVDLLIGPFKVNRHMCNIVLGGNAICRFCKVEENTEYTVWQCANNPTAHIYEGGLWWASTAPTKLRATRLTQCGSTILLLFAGASFSSFQTTSKFFWQETIELNSHFPPITLRIFQLVWFFAVDGFERSLFTDEIKNLLLVKSKQWLYWKINVWLCS